jgi:predicted TPR repeat methyltransferase
VIRSAIALWQSRIGEQETDVHRDDVDERAGDSPTAAIDALRAGNVHSAAGEPALALECFDRALAHGPDAATHAARAEVLEALGRTRDAELSWRRATEIDPGNVAYRLALGQALLALPDPGRARTALAEAVRLRPESSRAQRLLGRSLALLGDLDGAAAHYQEAIFLDPTGRDALFELGLLFVDNRRERDGIPLLERCARAAPDDAEVLFHLGRAWHGLLETARARGHLARVLELDPDDPRGAGALLERIDREESARVAGAASLPNDYVRALFDQYAERFDDSVRSQLGYHAPELLLALLDPFFAERSGRRPPMAGRGGGPASLDVLDLGCGTGLSGEPFRPFARELHGVDLSPAMIEQAARRGIYDRLVAADIRDILAEEPARWDLILACDTLLYLADLREVFQAVFAALRPAGAFAATVEAPEDGSEIQFKPTRRFGHSERYLASLAAESGFRVRVLQSSSVRRERGRPVPGFAWWFSKDPDAGAGAEAR